MYSANMCLHLQRLDYFVQSLFIFWLSIKCSIGKENAKVVKLLLLANFFSFFFFSCGGGGGFRLTSPRESETVPQSATSFSRPLSFPRAFGAMTVPPYRDSF